MILEDFIIVLSNTARSKAYVQILVKHNFIPSNCLIYSDDINKMQQEADSYYKVVDSEYFDVEEPIIYTLKAKAIPYQTIDSKDINSREMIVALSKCPQHYIIYSGYGSNILKTPILSIEKKFIHIHAGLLPQYRGSTTVYYSYLCEGTMGATAIFLNEQIDEGEIILQKEFAEIPKKVDIDYILDPYIRSLVLIEVIKRYIENGGLYGQKQNSENAQTYFVIHPVLKHLALFKLGLK